MKLESGPARVNGWIEVAEPGAALVLRIHGELDAASRLEIEPTITAATGTTGSMILDLDQLTFCDSSGVAMFIAVADQAKASGTALSIRNIGPSVRRVFEITNLDGLIALVE